MKTLSINEFEVLVVIEKSKKELSQREISKLSKLSLGTVNKTILLLLSKKMKIPHIDSKI